MGVQDSPGITLSREERIRRRALAIYKKRGDRPGSAIIDWLEAEEQIREDDDRALDEALEETFPASDPVAY